MAPFTPMGRSGLLPALHAAQRLNGWLPPEVAAEVAAALRIPLADVHGVIEFYTLFHEAPVGREIIRVCTDPPCALRGADRLLDGLCGAAGIAPGGTSADGSVTIEPVPCLGLCDHAPAALVGDRVAVAADPDHPDGLTEVVTTHPESVIYGAGRVLTAVCTGDTTAIGDYERCGGYQALRQAIAMGPEAVIAEVKASGLVGRGGAAFPTGVKWEAARSEPATPKYVVCNTDESEPGTFKDRALLIDSPHLTVEGMVIAGYAVGARKGYFYIRGEYPYIVPVVEQALAEARAAGYLGENILGSGSSFDIEVRVGAGAYICGEETALFESIEGKRGFPRVKPPFPTTHGLYGRPTVINNVETLCNVPHIIATGADAYRRLGTEGSSGPKLFCLSGDVARPGLYELPFGVTLRQLIDEHGGGVPGNRDLNAVLLGGAAGSFVTPDRLDVPLTMEDLR
ncbi:MAG TPA: NAD(P)H-dependent oxidoreductase subunit E, partial [Gemmatimonadales bacterium]|nr:NAD(P)H-dependent oxidoreductase subunit E [Gemmatimonadales bacterium]